MTRDEPCCGMQQTAGMRFAYPREEQGNQLVADKKGARRYLAYLSQRYSMPTRLQDARNANSSFAFLGSAIGRPPRARA